MRSFPSSLGNLYMHSILPSAILLCFIVMIAGCTIPAKDVTRDQHTPSTGPVTPPVTTLADSLTITPDTEFPYPLRTVPVPYQSAMTRGAFEDSFIHPMNAQIASNLS